MSECHGTLTYRKSQKKEGFTRHIHVPRPSGGCAVLIGCPTAMDGGSAENAGAFFGLPFCRTISILIKPLAPQK